MIIYRNHRFYHLLPNQKMLNRSDKLGEKDSTVIMINFQQASKKHQSWTPLASEKKAQNGMEKEQLDQLSYSLFQAYNSREKPDPSASSSPELDDGFHWNMEALDAKLDQDLSEERHVWNMKTACASLGLNSQLCTSQNNSTGNPSTIIVWLPLNFHISLFTCTTSCLSTLTHSRGSLPAVWHSIKMSWVRPLSPNWALVE